MSRDKELDDLEAELKEKLAGKPTPAVESPNERSIGDGTSCFLDVNRMCDADCRAFDNTVTPPEGPDVCTLLASAMDIATNLSKLVDVGNLLKKMNQDRQRVPTPTDPAGRKPPG